MRNIDIVRGIIFKQLGIGKEDFSERLISQKKVFMLGKFGVDLGFSYNWYIHGPYSPELTTYIYENLNILNELDCSDYSLNPEVTEKIETVNNFKKDIPKRMDEASWYELLASIVYLNERTLKRADSLYEELVKFKPQFTRENFNDAEKVLEAEKILPKENTDVTD